LLFSSKQIPFVVNLLLKLAKILYRYQMIVNGVSPAELGIFEYPSIRIRNRIPFLKKIFFIRIPITPYEIVSIIK
jgi:hypothetical protein